jgi:hypothetical protein
MPLYPIMHGNYEVMKPTGWWCRYFRVRCTLAGLLEAIYAMGEAMA